MTILTFFFALISNLVIGFFGAKNTHATEHFIFWGWSEEAFGIRTTANFMQTEANFLPSRVEYDNLPGGNRYNLLSVPTDIFYGITPYTLLGLGFRFAQANTIQDGYEKTTSQFDEIRLRSQFRYSTSLFLFIPEISVGIPLDRLDENTTYPMTHPGVLDVQIGSHLYRRLQNLRLLAYAGIKVPAEGLAKTAHYRIAIELPAHKTFGLGGGLQGYETVIGDDTFFRNRSDVADQANAGSLAPLTFNPALLEAVGWVRFQLDENIVLRVGGRYGLTGENSAKSIVLFATANLLTIGQRAPRGYELTRTRRQKTIESDLDRSFYVEPAEDFRRKPDSEKVIPSKERASEDTSLPLFKPWF